MLFKKNIKIASLIVAVAIMVIGTVPTVFASTGLSEAKYDITAMQHKHTCALGETDDSELGGTTLKAVEGTFDFSNLEISEPIEMKKLDPTIVDGETGTTGTTKANTCKACAVNLENGVFSGTIEAATAYGEVDPKSGNKGSTATKK